MARKTVNVEFLRHKVNLLLASTDSDMVESRITAYTLLESVLHETGNYHGYRYLSTEWDAENNRFLRADYDDSRRYYLSNPDFPENYDV